MFEMIAFDADDTLWHNEGIFQDTQKLFYQMLQPYADEEVIHQNLSKVEMSNVRLFGYGITGFTLSMIETALEISAGQIPQTKIQYIIYVFKKFFHYDLCVSEQEDCVLIFNACLFVQFL